MNQEVRTYKGEQTSSPSSSSIVSIILERSSISSNNIDSLLLEIFRGVRQHVAKGFEWVSEYCGVTSSSSAFLVSTCVYISVTKGFQLRARRVDDDRRRDWKREGKRSDRADQGMNRQDYGDSL